MGGRHECRSIEVQEPTHFPPRAAGCGRVCASMRAGLLSLGLPLFNREGEVGCEGLPRGLGAVGGTDGYSKETVHLRMCLPGRRRGEDVLLRGQGCGATRVLCYLTMYIIYN